MLIRISREPGLNPLVIATILGYPNIVKALLDAGAGVNDVEKVPNEGMTPLHFAGENGHADIVTVLIAAGAQVDARTRRCALVSGHPSQN